MTEHRHPATYMLPGGAVTWRTRKQPLVASLTVETEYIGVSDATKKDIWIQSLYARILHRNILPSRSLSTAKAQFSLQITRSSTSAPNTQASASTSSRTLANGTHSSLDIFGYAICSPTSDSLADIRYASISRRRISLETRIGSTFTGLGLYIGI